MSDIRLITMLLTIKEIQNRYLPRYAIDRLLQRVEKEPSDMPWNDPEEFYKLLGYTNAIKRYKDEYLKAYYPKEYQSFVELFEGVVSTTTSVGMAA
jgi:hypothetical protein